MGRRHKRRHRPAPIDARAFAEALEANEEMMSEGAAMAVTCEQFGIEHMDGIDLLVSLADEP